MNGLALLLDELGFDYNSIVEVILVTLNSSNGFNAAPMGVKRSGPNILVVDPFKASTSYLNLKLGSEVCINVTSEPMFFLTTAFKEYVEDQPHINSDLGIDGCDASLFCEVVEVRDVSDNRASASLKVKRVELWNPKPRVFSRGRAEAIEAVIHCTRLEVFKKSKEKVEQYLRLIRDCMDVVRRVSPEGSSEGNVIRVIEQLITSWGFKV